ncbi:MAG: DUF3467 domain-containing protein [Bryobacteraceae bacterium]|nr:DUF3467 domain-containing protein [Bryobacteraceae bacterium]
MAKRTNDKRTANEKSEPRRETLRSPQFASVYANDIQVQITPWDLRFIFGEVTEAPTKELPRVLVTLLAEVRVSPQMAKKLVEIVKSQLDGYEQTFGVIPSPPDED